MSTPLTILVPAMFNGPPTQPMEASRQVSPQAILMVRQKFPCARHRRSTWRWRSSQQVTDTKSGMGTSWL